MRVLVLCLSVATCGTAWSEPDAQRQQALLNMLKHDCGSCHGLPPRGGLGPSLMPEALAGKSDAWLLDAIQNGRPGTAMPPWKPFLTIDETVWMIAQLRQGMRP